MANYSKKETSNLNLIMMEDVRNYIVRWAPQELSMSYIIHIYKNSIETNLYSNENTLMKIECTIEKKEGKNDHGF